MALCLSPQQRQNCLRLRNAHLHKVRDIMQDRYRINDMMQSTLPSYDFELQAARQHLRALQARPPQTIRETVFTQTVWSTSALTHRAYRWMMQSRPPL